MAEEEKRQRRKRVRQEWNPPLLLSLLHKLWMVAFGAFKIALGAAATVAMIIGVCGLVFAGILGDYLQNDIAPNAGMDLDDIILDQTSTIYYVDSDDNIQVLQEIYTSINRKWADLEDIPKNLIHAAVAIEDQRFYEHQGVDWFTTVKAFARMFFGDDASVGGSSITQQLIKNLKQEADVTIQRKVLEWFRAIDLEKHYSKDEIMERYLNCIFLGEDQYGVRSAAEYYFGKEVQELSLLECASLISITNSPTLYDPYLNPKENYNRTVNVLWAMRNQGWIDEEEYQEALGQDMVSRYVLQELLNEDEVTQEEYDDILEKGWISEEILQDILADMVVTQEEYDRVLAENTVFKTGIEFEDRWAECQVCGYEGPNRTLNTAEDGLFYCPSCGAQVEVRQDESQEMYSYFVDTVIIDVAKAFAAQDGVDWDDLDEDGRNFYLDKIRHGGYSIYSTIDMNVQKTVDMIYQDLSQIPDTRSGQQLQSAIVIIDNKTGDIVGMSGGVGEKTDYLGWNRATDSNLQTGSSIKPLSVYGPAFELTGISPATVVKDLPITYEGGAFPMNDTMTYSYSRTIFSAIVDSVNACASNTLLKAGIDYCYSFAKNQFGLSSLVDEYVDGYGTVHTDIGVGPLSLGAQTFGLTVREMASAFATYANKGVYRNGRTFTKVYDSKGNLVIDNTQETREILSTNTVNYINYCLRHAVLEGTGDDAAFDYSSGAGNVSVYGKTGSTSEWKDRWFCGFTGYYTGAVWVGYDYPEVINMVNEWRHPGALMWKKVMQPLHVGLPDINLVDTTGMQWTTMCLASGKVATDACRADIRAGEGFSSVSTSVPYYPGDQDLDRCDKHIMVDYCVDGQGVASEYCKLFAAEKQANIEQRALVKMTEEEVEEIRQAGKVGLNAYYLRDDYIYLINEDGTDAVFKGLKNDINKNVDAPYLVCPVHTKEAWEEYQASQNPTEPSTPTRPTPSRNER